MIEREALIHQCLESIRQLSNHHHDPPVVLVRSGKGRMPKGWPRGGELLNCRGEEKTVAYSAMKVLSFALTKMALPKKAEVDPKDDDEEKGPVCDGCDADINHEEGYCCPCGAVVCEDCHIRSGDDVVPDTCVCCEPMTDGEHPTRDSPHGGPA